jgi:hypothetical protein
VSQDLDRAGGFEQREERREHSPGRVGTEAVQQAAGIATDMGFASFKVMPAERWAEALAKVNAALEA